MYRSKSYRVRPLEDVLEEIRSAAEDAAGVRRVFLADGDALAAPFDVLRAVLEADAVFYAAHTNLDRAEGGVVDTLARRLNLRIESEACDGFGRLCEVPGSEEELLNALRNLSPLTTVYGDWEGVGRVLVVPGAAPDGLVMECLRCGVDAVIVGEIKYHARAELLEERITVVELGHEYSELPGVQGLARRVREEFRDLNVEVVPPPDLTIIR
jgi:putative NIF3 family GTP cyclohydrolase 1 type 2